MSETSDSASARMDLSSGGHVAEGGGGGKGREGYDLRHGFLDADTASQGQRNAHSLRARLSRIFRSARRRDVARALDTAALAKKAGLASEILGQAFAPGGEPTLSTLVSVVGALGFELSLKRRLPTA